jgi:hypothetical protein
MDSSLPTQLPTSDGKALREIGRGLGTGFKRDAATLYITPERISKMSAKIQANEVAFLLELTWFSQYILWTSSLLYNLLCNSIIIAFIE